ncbi:MAG: HD domain-containing protein [Elusimicrobiota bacterium]|nr:HD domain-containing protein [Elusimicrobiota bacterium]
MQKKYYIFLILSSTLIFIVSLYLLKISVIFSIIIIITYFFLTYLTYHIVRQLFDYERVYKIISELSHHSDFQSLFNYVVHSISELLSAERSSIFLVNSDTNVLWTIAAEELEIKEIVLPIGQGIAGYVAKTGEVVVINDDVYNDPRFLPIVDHKTGFRTKTTLCAPIYDKKGNIIGVIEVLNKKSKRGFTNYDVNLLKLFCLQLGDVIISVQLYNQLQMLLESLLKSFAAAIDARDPTTKGHSLRVMKYALNIAKEMKLPENDVKSLQYAAILHDVGKIGVPDSILLKADKFTPEEYEVMKKHVEITREILSNIYFPPEFKNVPAVACSHHEFMDGTGYPEGLNKEKLSLLSRILCVADIYDALISYDRPYKPPYTQQEAIKIMYKMADEGKLDKEILDLFITKKLYQIEQRKFVRINKEVAFAWRKLQSGEIKSLLPIISKTINVSARGLQFISDEFLPVGTYLEVELYLPDLTIETISKVVHSSKFENEQNKYRIGLQFINLPQDIEIELQSCLKKLEQQTN